MKKKVIGKIVSVFLAAILLTAQLYVQDGLAVEAEELALTVCEDNNPLYDFECGNDLEDWEVSGSVSEVLEGGHDGGEHILMGSNATLKRTITDIPQGTYTLSIWVKGASSGNSAKFTVSETGGPDAVAKIDTNLTTDSWNQMGHRNVLVYNGQMTIEIQSGTSSGLYIDDICLTLDREDNNTVKNWGFEECLNQWQVSGDATISLTEADTGNKALVLGSGSQISQVISVEPNTSYIATMRGKVDEQDTYKTIDQYGATNLKIGEVVERTSLGDRVSLGVKTIDGTILRQAPSGTEDYSLVTIAFTTGSNDTQVILYANTIYDQGYKDSITVYQDGEPYLSDEWTGNGDDLAYVDNIDVFEVNNEYIKGADVSFLPLEEDEGGKYFANGVQQDCLRIISNHGVNSIISMIFVHSGNYVYNPDTMETMYIPILDENGDPYPRQNQEGYFDKEHILNISMRATDLGMSFMPGFQYSDNWMSASKAYTPQEWLNVDYEGNLSNANLEVMKSAVYNYVYDFLTALKDNNVNVIGVKHGNEQNGGIVWPIGRGGTSNGHAALIASSLAAGREVLPEVSHYIHSNNGYDPASSDAFFGTLLNKGADTDGLAYSLYGGRPTSKMFGMLDNNMSQERFKFKDYVNVEAGVSFTKYNPTPDYDAAVISPIADFYSRSVNGQYNWLLDYIQAPLDIPNAYGQTRGFYYWETDWLPTKGAGIGTGRNVDISSRIMFNNGDVSIQEMGSSQPGKSGDMIDSMYAYLIRGFAKDKEAQLLTPLKGNGEYTVSQTEPTGITFNQGSINLTVGEVERIEPIVTPTDQVLTETKIKWSSNNPEVATVSDAGFISAHGQGVAVITGSIGAVSNTITVTVADAVISQDGDLVLTINGNTINDGDVITADVFDKVNVYTTLTDSVTDQTIVYTSSDPEMVSFFGETWQTPEGQMRQLASQTDYIQVDVNKGGEATILASTEDGGDTVSFKIQAVRIPVESLVLDRESYSMFKEDTLQLNAVVMPQEATLYKTIWSSSDESVAKVDDKGLVTAIGVGTVDIYAVSDDNDSIVDICSIEVAPVVAEEIYLDYSIVNLTVGRQKQLTATILPQKTENKQVIWSVEDNPYITVDDNGKITAVSVGGPVTVSAVVEGTGLTALCDVTVQASEVLATAVDVTPEVYYFKSDYFSSTNPLVDNPMSMFFGTFLPENGITGDLLWSSDDSDVVSVNHSGLVTAHQSGVASVTAIDGLGNSASATVYVPIISESFDNRDTGDSWGMTSDNGSITSAVADGKLVISGSGANNLGVMTKTFTPIINDKVILDFTWDIGTLSGSEGMNLSFNDALNNPYVILKVTDEGALYFGSGNQDGIVNETAVGNNFTGSNRVYHVQMIMDYKTESFDLTVTSMDTPSVTAIHRNNPFNGSVTYNGDFASMAIAIESGSSVSVETAFLDWHAFAGAPVPMGIELNASKIKLVPVSNTLGASYQLSSKILPEAANQSIVWTSSDLSVATVDENGLVVATNMVESLDAIVDGTCVITAQSEANPEVIKEVVVSVGSPSNSAEYFDIINEQGKNIAEDGVTVEATSGDVLQWTGHAYGVDGDTEIASLTWSSNNDSVLRIIPKASNPLEAMIYVIGGGLAEVTLDITSYNGDVRSASVYLQASGDQILVMSELEQVLEEAKVALIYPDGYYTQESLSAFNNAWESGRDIYEQSQSEGWGYDKQDQINQATEHLREGIAGLTVRENITIETIILPETGYPVSLGKEVDLSVSYEPYYATDTALVWSTSDSSIIEVDTDGSILAVGIGEAKITVTAVNGSATADITVKVTDDLSSWYDYQGGSVTASVENGSNTAEKPLVNARTMSYRESVWSPATSYPAVWEVDMGDKATIQEIYMAQWVPQKYTIELSEDGEVWWTAFDRSDDYYGEAFDALKLSDGSYGTRYRISETLTSDNFARYIRVTVLDALGSNWGSIELFKATGSFGNIVAPEGMTITGPDYPISIGRTVALEASFQPESATNKTVNWQSDNASILTVDDNGLVKGLQPGTATVTATTEDGLEDSVVIEVTDDMSSWYNSQGGSVTASTTSGSSIAKNPLVNARTMAYRTSAWSPATTLPSSWTVDLGASGTIEEIYMSAWAAQRYTIEVSEDGDNWAMAADRTDAYYGEAFDAVKPSDGSVGTRYHVTEALTMNNYGRYIRVTLTGVESGWASIELFKATGSFGISGDIDVEEVELQTLDYPVTIGRSVQLETSVTPVEVQDAALNWASDDTGIVTVNDNGIVTAQAVGTATITVTSENGVSDSVDIEVTDDMSSWYNSQGGSVTASTTSGSNVAKNPLENARTMAYRTSAWSPATTLPSSWTVDLGASGTIEEIYMSAWAAQKYTIEVSEDGENWTMAVDRTDAYYGEAFDAVKPSDGSVGTRYRVTEALTMNNYGRYIRVTLTGVESGWASIELFKATGSF